MRFIRNRTVSVIGLFPSYKSNVCSLQRMWKMPRRMHVREKLSVLLPALVTSARLAFRLPLCPADSRSIEFQMTPRCFRALRALLLLSGSCSSPAPRPPPSGSRRARRSGEDSPASLPARPHAEPSCGRIMAWARRARVAGSGEHSSNPAAE